MACCKNCDWGTERAGRYLQEDRYSRHCTARLSSRSHAVLRSRTNLKFRRNTLHLAVIEPHDFQAFPSYRIQSLDVLPRSRPHLQSIHFRPIARYDAADQIIRIEDLPDQRHSQIRPGNVQQRRRLAEEDNPLAAC